MKEDKLPFELPNEDPIEKVRRIANFELNELFGEDLKIRLAYEAKQELQKDEFFGDLRSYLYDFGYPIQTGEMKRDFYLKNRLSKIERKNLVDVFGVVEKSAINNRLSFGYSIMGVGTSTYSEDYFDKTEKWFMGHGITRESEIIEDAFSYFGQFSDFETYEEYFKKFTEENKERPFDDKLKIVSKEEFIRDKGNEQKEYKLKKKLGDILERKGEDLDFIICHDGWNDWSVGDYTRNKMKEFKRNFELFSKEKGYEFFNEFSYLAGSDYRIYDGEAFRNKSIDGVRSTCRIKFPEGRSFHFYFEDRFSMNEKIRDERIRGYPFVQLLLRNNFKDLEDTILFGEKTGIFENPYILKLFEKR